MPEETGVPFILRLKMQVAMGPVIMEVTQGAIQILGFRTILPICSMEVPIPWETRPPHLFSGKDMTAKPTICAQQPATAAPPARPVRPRAAQIAALEIGRVSAMPTNRETRMPIRKGWSSVAHMIRSPAFMAALPRAGAHQAERAMPTPMVTMGVTRRSTLVSLETAFPISAEMIATNSTARGPPAPPRALEANPTVIREKSTSGGQWSAYPMAVAMAGPLMAEARPPTV